MDFVGLNGIYCEGIRLNGSSEGDLEVIFFLAFLYEGGMSSWILFVDYGILSVCLFCVIFVIIKLKMFLLVFKFFFVNVFGKFLRYLFDSLGVVKWEMLSLVNILIEFNLFWFSVVLGIGCVLVCVVSFFIIFVFFRCFCRVVFLNRIEGIFVWFWIGIRIRIMYRIGFCWCWGYRFGGERSWMFF